MPVNTGSATALKLSDASHYTQLEMSMHIRS